MPFPDNFITELTERSDIVDVVSGYVRLTKRSGANMFGLCPFHSEKTPSFSVSRDKQIYHCFGCGKGGGVINFIMEIENLSFPEAVEFLAKRAGMPMPEETNDRESRKRARMLALNKDAARFFYEQLSTAEGRRAGEYMVRRRISPATAKTFGLGFAPNTWDSLRNAMERRGYSGQELFEAGLVRRGKNGGFYDTFRDRLMFPVIDVRGNVIGFSGRILGDGEPKYMNSPETLVFNKSRNLFALNLAKKSKSGYIILSEGNIDVVSLHQAGFDSAVASLGTSLTPEQARLLSRYTDQVIIAYDNDGAGVKAAQRAIGILEKLDMRVKVLRMSGAKDPDEFIRTRGADAFRNLLEASENQVDYRLNEIAKKYDLTMREQKIEFLNEAYNVVARLADSAQRELFARQLANMVDVNEATVISEVSNRRSQLFKQAKKEEQRELARPVQQAKPVDKRIRYTNPISAVAEEGLIALLYSDPELSKRSDLPSASTFSSEELGHIYSSILKKNKGNSSVNISSLSDELSFAEIAQLTEIIHKYRVKSNREKAFKDYIERIQEQNNLAAENADLNALADSLRDRKGYKGKDV